MRISMRDLEAVLSLINKKAGFGIEAKPWALKDGENTATVGFYVLDGAYGGWKLGRLVNEAGGQENITDGGYCSKKELYYQMRAFLRGLEATE